MGQKAVMGKSQCVLEEVFIKKVGKCGERRPPPSYARDARTRTAGIRLKGIWRFTARNRLCGVPAVQTTDPRITLNAGMGSCLELHLLLLLNYYFLV